MKLLIQYLGLCWFINNPADLVPPKSFIWKTVIFYLISGCIVEGLIADPADGSLEVFLRTIMAFSSIATLLFFTKKLNLFQQLFTAIFICENFIMTLATAVEGMYFWMVMKKYPDAETISIWLGVFLVIWYISIISYILRQLFSYKMSLSILMAVGYFVLTYGIPMMFMDI